MTDSELKKLKDDLSHFVDMAVQGYGWISAA